MDRLLWYLFAGSRGGPTRIRLMQQLLAQPRNAHQLAKDLGRDYKTIEYNLRVLLKHVVVVSDDPKAYGALYRPSKNFMAALSTFEHIVAQPTKSKGKRHTSAKTSTAESATPPDDPPRDPTSTDPAVGET